MNRDFRIGKSETARHPTSEMALSNSFIQAGNLAQAKRSNLGEWLGTGTDKYINIAFSVIVIYFIMIFFMAFKFDLHQDFDNFLKFCSHILSILTGALGYLFGLKNSKD